MGPKYFGAVFIACCLAAYVQGQTASNVDPCDDYTEIDDRKRSTTFQPGPGENLICDNTLPTGWYRFMSGTMPGSCVEPYHCGTQVPIWMSGTHPTDDQIADREVCMNYGVPGNCCPFKMAIKVKRCMEGLYYVYFLQPANGCSMAYCVESRSVTCSDHHCGNVVIHNPVCYKLSDGAQNHQNSGQACTAMGGTLARIKDATTQRFVADRIRENKAASHWVGIQQPATTFLYSDWSAVQNQQLWAPDQPPQLCAYMDSGANYKFSAAVCSEEHEFVCQSDIVNCQQDVCQNGGTCTSCFADSHKTCSCLPGFTGNRCEINIDECSSSPCLNGGTCSDRDNSYVCVCPQGFDGNRCQTDLDLCDPNPCPFGWNCIDQGETLTCGANIRQPNQRFSRCSASSCPAGMTCRDDGPGIYTCMP